MSIEMRMEKTLKSNSKKEVTALDVIVNDAATGALPYMSRSGGERVKAALSVILALAELKSSTAGVQLGFLLRRPRGYPETLLLAQDYGYYSRPGDESPFPAVRGRRKDGGGQ